MKAALRGASKLGAWRLEHLFWYSRVAVSEQYVITGGTMEAIAESVEAAVAAGALAPGDRLPSVRALASQLEVSPTTVFGALAELRRRGVVVSRPRSGTRVADRPPLRATRAVAAVPVDARDLALGNPDPKLLPEMTGAVLALAATGLVNPAAGATFSQRLYGEEPVEPSLAALAREAFVADGVPAERIVVVSGALDGIERVLAAQLSPGDVVAVEDPGWPGVLDLARALGLRLAPVAVDDFGMKPEALAAALRTGAKAAIVTPRGQNPFGAAHDKARAAELRELLRDVFVVEDDHLGPVAGVQYRTVAGRSGRWAVVRSVSKWLGPDLRCAVMAGDQLTLARVEGRLALGPAWVSGILQRLVVALWERADARGAADVYAARRGALVGALGARGLAAHGRSGLNVWVPVVDEDAVVRALLAARYSVAGGGAFRLGAGPAVRVTTAALDVAEAVGVADAIAGAVNPPRRTRAA
ncbi:aminotransferase class I/II-fold pyridoxal phosphate-dependent enzyme [Solirubrobacter phytolaccae]|uniref:Aminotransferase class I/II-fold pyridoxal phosphate-dependent enzyme n=1 Tax=Solirubrobacter phytolaccae TaxID=1404360 RepID=A0A9X3N9X3_9ACTN|nr:aminotransferase class I/II-fold pyridoxal phosphate-dependent enzyme [Solirubrobacter phytolaccae]MDA0182483.1 aminotransferase class I/II-fold pyridoxal phosphate-dependent enzyme [Solirubrobacter phytolaccae]